MAGALQTGAGYSKSAVRGAAGAARNVMTKRNVRRGLEMQAKTQEQNEKFRLEELEQERDMAVAAARTRRNMSGMAMAGGAIGAVYGGAPGFAVGSAIGGFVGGLF
jgi:hypothetical protein